MKHRTFAYFATRTGKNLSLTLSLALACLLYSPQAKPMLNQQVTNLKDSLTILKNKFVQLSTELATVKTKLGQKAPLKPVREVRMQLINLETQIATAEELLKKLPPNWHEGHMKQTDLLERYNNFIQQKNLTYVLSTPEKQELDVKLKTEERKLLEKMIADPKGKILIGENIKKLENQLEIADKFLKFYDMGHGATIGHLTKKMRSTINRKITSMQASLDTNKINDRKEKFKNEFQRILNIEHIHNQMATIKKDIKEYFTLQAEEDDQTTAIKQHGDLSTILEAEFIIVQQKRDMIDFVISKNKALLGTSKEDRKKKDDWDRLKTTLFFFIYDVDLLNQLERHKNQVIYLTKRLEYLKKLLELKKENLKDNIEEALNIEHIQNQNETITTNIKKYFTLQAEVGFEDETTVIKQRGNLSEILKSEFISVLEKRDAIKYAIFNIKEKEKDQEKIDNWDDLKTKLLLSTYEKEEDVIEEILKTIYRELKKIEAKFYEYTNKPQPIQSTNLSIAKDLMSKNAPLDP
ncbi:MAG: hypothetical protein ABH827_05975, partial [bacterium]